MGHKINNDCLSRPLEPARKKLLAYNYVILRIIIGTVGAQKSGKVLIQSCTFMHEWSTIIIGSKRINILLRAYYI